MVWFLQKTRNKKICIMLSLCIGLFLCLVLTVYLQRNQAEETVQMQNSTGDNGCEDLLVNTYLKRIQRVSDSFYQEYYTVVPTVTSGEVRVKELQSDSTKGQVTFTVEPFLGPHDTIGVDEITFSADYMGNIKVEEVKHIISYSLPDNLKDLEKKRVPGEYGN